RKLAGEGQENGKRRAQLTYGAFLDQITDPERATRIGAWFWGVQEVPDILDRWGQDLPPSNGHLVTVPPAGGVPTLPPSSGHRVTGPPPGGAPELLWKRFIQAFGLDGIDLDLEGER